jgi:SHS family lactate transporter-like MFS transporter
LSPIAQLRALNGHQWRAFFAAYLGWMLDAFDFFLLVMVVRNIADDFHTKIPQVSTAIFLTLATRPIGALFFGMIADRYGRRPALMGGIAFYAAVELASAFAPTLGTLLFLRALFGIGMGGVWGVGASLAMESVPAPSRGLLSGVLQQGYPAGYLLAALTYGLVFPHYGWRGMFIVGAFPALLVVFIHRGVRESPAWIEAQAAPKVPGKRSALVESLKSDWKLFLFMVGLMACFNIFSHGTQDLYPSGFLGKQRGFDVSQITRVVITYNVGAIVGGMLFGALSQYCGRRRTIAAAALLAIPVIPFWVGPWPVAGVAASAFFLQFFVQGAWGVVPAHLNELSPTAVRGTFPGLAYQLGNLVASYIVPLQARIAEAPGGSYSFSLGIVIAVFAVVLAAVALLGPEKSSADLTQGTA